MEIKIYDDDVLSEINQGVDLLEYVSQSMDFEKHGDEYFAHCPLHVDLTPSFSITPKENLFYCFSCGKGGGIINYLRYYEGMRFNDAVEKASKLANVDLGSMCKSDTVAFLKKVRKLFQNPQYREYEHKILDESILDTYDKEQIKEWESEGINPDVMDLFGVKIDNDKNRIIYPVRDIKGNLINIKARTRYENYKRMRIPKYINYYQVGVMDYFQGLDITLPFIQEKKEIIIFESIKSVMKAYGWGYKNCASAEKHSLTMEQIRVLTRLKVDIVFAYDSDVSYKQPEIRENIDKLKRITNVYIIEDKLNLLGGKDAKNAPVDCGKELWEELYTDKRKEV